MALNEKGTFGVTVEPILSASNEGLTEKTPATSTISIPPSPSTHPFTGDATSPLTRLMYASSTAAPSKTQLSFFSQDLEAYATPPYVHTANASSVCLACDEKECTMWPSRVSLKEKARLRKGAERCCYMGNLSKAQRLWLKVLVALVVIGLAVGLGVGISRALGTGVWKNANTTTPFPQDND